MYFLCFTDLLKSHSVSSNTGAYEEPFLVDAPQSKRSDSSKPPSSHHSKSSRIDSTVSQDSRTSNSSNNSNSSKAEQNEGKHEDAEVFGEYSKINPKFPVSVNSLLVICNR